MNYNMEIYPQWHNSGTLILGVANRCLIGQLNRREFMPGTVNIALRGEPTATIFLNQSKFPLYSKYFYFQKCVSLIPH